MVGTAKTQNPGRCCPFQLAGWCLKTCIVLDLEPKADPPRRPPLVLGRGDVWLWLARGGSCGSCGSWRPTCALLSTTSIVTMLLTATYRLQVLWRRYAACLRWHGTRAGYSAVPARVPCHVRAAPNCLTLVTSLIPHCPQSRSQLGVIVHARVVARRHRPRARVVTRRRSSLSTTPTCSQLGVTPHPRAPTRAQARAPHSMSAQAGARTGRPLTPGRPTD